MRKVSFDEAKVRFVNRYTMEHIPAWSRYQAPNGLYYAPQFATDREWYENTTFPGEPDHPIGPGSRTYCNTTGQTWPLGKWLDEPFIRGPKRVAE